MAELLWFSIRSKVVRTEINKDIKSGTIAYNINKPYNYIFYVLSKYIGEVIISFIFNVIIAIILGIVIVGNLNNFNILSIPFIVITFFLGSIIAAFIYILIGLISFWVEENKPFIWIYERLILVLGIIFPIEILPTYLQGIAKWSPVYTVTYAPAKMVVDFSFNRWLEITLFQGIYLFIVALLTFYIYSKGVKRLNVNGG
jgi:ABC-2 type transport system permease protein